MRFPEAYDPNCMTSPRLFYYPQILPRIEDRDEMAEKKRMRQREKVQFT
jgi:hypothetical protein